MTGQRLETARKASKIPRNLQTIQFKLDTTLESGKRQPQRLSEIFPTLIGCNQNFLLDIRRRRWPLGMKAQLQMFDDLTNDLRIFNESDNEHLASTRRTDQWIHFLDLAEHLRPAF